ncbi:MAG TPA: OB-fold domain-containing protein [Alphaproteobacteria bacterium]|nr:OB-fold domain-containing protein [Alphaproteobacteria bacterium]
MSYQKPIPNIDPDSAPYWEAAKQGKLMIQRCKVTGQAFLYSRQLTPGVVDNEVEWIESSGKGTIYSFTVARRPAGEAFATDVPYVIVSVELAEGARIMTNLVTDDPDSVAIGQPVEVVFDKVSDELTIPKFRHV